jgi:protein-tyrosine-phosphatase
MHMLSRCGGTDLSVADRRLSRHTETTRSASAEARRRREEIRAGCAAPHPSKHVREATAEAAAEAAVVVPERLPQDVCDIPAAKHLLEDVLSGAESTEVSSALRNAFLAEPVVARTLLRVAEHLLSAPGS